MTGAHPVTVEPLVTHCVHLEFYKLIMYRCIFELFGRRNLHYFTNVSVSQIHRTVGLQDKYVIVPICLISSRTEMSDVASSTMYTQSQTYICSVLWNVSPNRTECPMKFRKVSRTLQFRCFFLQNFAWTHQTIINLIHCTCIVRPVDFIHMPR